MAGIADADSVDAFAAKFGADIGMLQASLPTGSTVTLSPLDFFNVYVAARDGAPSVGFARAVSGTATVISRATGAASIGQAAQPTTRFFDTFTNPLSNQWTYDPGVTLNAGRVSISTSGVTPGHYPVIETIQKYKLSGAGFAANMVQVLPRSGNYETQIESGPNYENHCGFYLFAYGFLGYVTTNGVRTEYALPAYDPTAHRWWRVREAGGYIFFDTSPNGTTWTNHTSGPHSWSTESCYLIVKCGYWGTTPAAQNILCDEVSLTAT